MPDKWESPEIAYNDGFNAGRELGRYETHEKDMWLVRGWFFMGCACGFALAYMW